MNYGKKYMGTARTTFVINPSGEVVKIYEKVEPKIHAREIVQDLKVMQGDKA